MKDQITPNGALLSRYYNHNRTSFAARFKVLSAEDTLTRMNKVKYHNDMHLVLNISNQENQRNQAKFVATEGTQKLQNPERSRS